MNRNQLAQANDIDFKIKLEEQKLSRINARKIDQIYVCIDDRTVDISDFSYVPDILGLIKQEIELRIEALTKQLEEI